MNKKSKAKNVKEKTQKRNSKNVDVTAFSLEPEAIKKLNIVAKKLDRSKSYIVNNLIKTHLKLEGEE